MSKGPEPSTLYCGNAWLIIGYCRPLIAVDFFKESVGGGTRVGALGDGAADDDKVGAIANRIRGSGYTFLIALCGPCWTYARCEYDEALSGYALANQANLVWRGHDAVQP